MSRLHKNASAVTGRAWSMQQAVVQRCSCESSCNFCNSILAGSSRTCFALSSGLRASPSQLASCACLAARLLLKRMCGSSGPHVPDALMGPVNNNRHSVLHHA